MRLNTADCQKVGNPVFLVQVVYFLIHLCLVPQKDRRQKPRIFFCAELFQSFPGPFPEAVSGRLQRIRRSVCNFRLFSAHPAADVPGTVIKPIVKLSRVSGRFEDFQFSHAQKLHSWKQLFFPYLLRRQIDQQAV